MKITISITTDGAAFDDWHNGEIRRILQTVANDIESGRAQANAPPGQVCTDNETFGINGRRLHDCNGNQCGRLWLAP